MATTAFTASPILPGAIIKMDNYLVWCASMIQDDSGRCHLYYSFWAEEKGHNGWVTDSRIAYASAEQPEGPYEFKSIFSLEDDACGRVVHNPAVACFGQRYYLYFMDNNGNGEFWNHRNNQKICMAWADKPEGPWKKIKRPLIPTDNDRNWTGIMASNPSVTMTLDGRFLMIYKWVDNKNPAPFYGPVKIGAAFADSPEGPFVRVSDDLFRAEGAAFPGEDPFVFVHGSRYYTILKDNNTFFNPESKSFILFESEDGILWHPAEKSLALARHLVMPDGKRQSFDRMERPHLTFCKDRVMMFCAVKPDAELDGSFAVGFEVVLNF